MLTLNPGKAGAPAHAGAATPETAAPLLLPLLVLLLLPGLLLVLQSASACSPLPLTPLALPVPGPLAVPAAPASPSRPPPLPPSPAPLNTLFKDPGNLSSLGPPSKSSPTTCTLGISGLTTVSCTLDPPFTASLSCTCHHAALTSASCILARFTAL